jgi:branched-chain amino acid transport system substrate-binding protein
MKKALYCLTIAAFVFSAAGCAAQPTTPAASTDNTAATSAPATDTSPAATAPASDTSAATAAPASASANGEPDVCAKDSIGCAKIPAGETIKIGMGAPMTGGDASYGIDISQGAKVAATDAGEFQGFPFEIDVEDDFGNAEGGAAVANKLIADPTVVAIAGHIYSGATAASIPVYEKAGIVMMSPSATLPSLTTTGSKVFNRIVFTDAYQGKSSANYLYTKLGIKNLAIMHDGSDYGKGLAEIVQKEYTALGGTVVIFQAITPKETDYTAPLAAVAAKKPEAVYFAGYTAEGSIIANQMKQTGLEKALFFGCDGTYGEDFLNRVGANGEGAYAVSLTPSDSPEKQKFDSEYLAAYGKAAGTLTPYTWNGYDAAAVLIHVIESVAVKGSDGNMYVPRGTLVEAVRSLKDYKGLTGTFACDATGECYASSPHYVVIKDGKWTVADNQ